DSRREEQHLQVWLPLNLEMLQSRNLPAGYQYPYQRVGAEECQEDTEQAAGPGEQESFGEDLANQAKPAGTQGDAQRHLALAESRARQEQAGDIGAGDEQEQAHYGHQQQQRLSELIAQE